MTKHEKRNKRKYRHHLQSLMSGILFGWIYLDVPLSINQRITLIELDLRLRKL